MKKLAARDFEDLLQVNTLTFSTWMNIDFSNSARFPFLKAFYHLRMTKDCDDYSLSLLSFMVLLSSDSIPQQPFKISRIRQFDLATIFDTLKSTSAQHTIPKIYHQRLWLMVADALQRLPNHLLDPRPQQALVPPPREQNHESTTCSRTKIIHLVTLLRPSGNMEQLTAIVHNWCSTCPSFLYVSN